VPSRSFALPLATRSFQQLFGTQAMRPLSPWRSVLLFLVVGLPSCFLPSVVVASGAYTSSLLVFAVPAMALARSLSAKGQLREVERDIAMAWALLVPMGAVMNVLFADDFFRYPTVAAVCGLSVPAMNGLRLDASRPIPIEEFAFYALGFLTMLLLYVWADRVLVPWRRPPRIARRWGALEAVLVPLALTAAGWGVSEAPSYWTWLCLVPLPVTLLVWPRLVGCINRRALAVTVALMLVTSFMWEAVLAVPRGWWGYASQAMLGPTLFGLPIEAVVVWLLAPITTVALFEALRGRRPVREGRQP
jgi:hypothetical protein